MKPGKAKLNAETRKRTMLHDTLDFISFGIKALYRDDFTKCFKPIHPDELDGSGIFYIFSIILRYFIILPFRITIFLLGSLFFLMGFAWGVLENSESKLEKVFLFYIKVFVFSFGANIKHHGNKKRLPEPHIFVANHTSFLDFLVLSSHKFCHASISEVHGGLFGFFFRTFLTRNGSLLFKRSDKNDRNKVLKLIKDHVKKKNAPMLIFPEGTCVNNKYSVLFQKGAFDLDVLVCPVAVKYRKKLLDPYWNTSKHTFFIHLLYLMSRWKLDVEVYWMDPVERENHENASAFAMRVKKMISEKAGLQNVLWNGYFKSTPVLKDREVLREAFKVVYNNHINMENEKFKYTYKIKSKDRRIVKYEQDICEIESDEGDSYVFYNYNYRKYLDTVLKEYLSLKSSSKKLEKLLSERSQIFGTNALMWLDEAAEYSTFFPHKCNKQGQDDPSCERKARGSPSTDRSSTFFEHFSKYY